MSSTASSDVLVSKCSWGVMSGQGRNRRELGRWAVIFVRGLGGLYVRERDWEAINAGRVQRGCVRVARLIRANLRIHLYASRPYGSVRRRLARTLEPSGMQYAFSAYSLPSCARKTPCPDVCRYRRRRAHASGQLLLPSIPSCS